MSPLERLIRDRIAKNGPIPVSKYMELALAQFPNHTFYDPQFMERQQQQQQQHQGEQQGEGKEEL